MRKMEQKININWYPGHMAKARRALEEKLKKIDIVVEVLDAALRFIQKIRILTISLLPRAECICSTKRIWQIPRSQKNGCATLKSKASIRCPFPQRREIPDIFKAKLKHMGGRFWRERQKGYP